MASKHPYKVALHCTDKEPVKVNNLAAKVIQKMTTNANDFPNSGALIATLTTDNTKLSNYISLAKGDHAMKDKRDAQSKLVYKEMNTKLRHLVDDVADGDKTIIDESGFDATEDATAHGIPAVPVISKITDVKKAPGTAKILLEKKKKKELVVAKAANKGAGLKYTAQTTPAPHTDTSKWTNAVEGVSSKALLLTGLVKANEIDVRVRAEDGDKKSAWSEPMSFLPRTSAPSTTPAA
ncbi:MAG: hypothetical protein HY063_10155 [Bacteroidetes bacterium]|nr:hypothetical protein [Bacteroidota bacterium]